MRMSMTAMSNERHSSCLVRGLAVLILVCWLQGSSHAYDKTVYVSIEAETRLLSDLFQEYDKRVRPVMKPNETIHASFGMAVRALLYLNEKDETMETLSYLLMSWHDGRLAWNYTDYAGVDNIKIPAEDIWKPDFLPYTTTEENVNLMDTAAVVYASGHVIWIPTLYLRSPCTVNLKAFPFDEQRCTIMLASYVYHGNHLNLTYWGGAPQSSLDVTELIANSNWDLVGHSVAIGIKKYQCCPEPYPQMKIVLAFKRNPSFYIHIFVVPAILLGLLAPTSLLLPPESNERITLGSIVILSILFINVNLWDTLPAAHNQIPAISVYYTLTLLWSVASLMCSILILNLHHRGPRRAKVPDTIRWIFLRSLRRLVCLGTDNYYPLSDMEAISMRGLQPPGNAGNQEVRGNSTSSKLERDMEDVSRQLNHLSTRFAKKEVRHDVLDEWHQVALVIDRTLFLLFIFIFILCSIILLA